MWDFEKFIHAWRSFPFIMTVLNCTPTSAKRAADIHCVGFTVLDHPPYTPNLAVLDFHLSPKLKEHVRGHRSVHWKMKSRLWLSLSFINMHSSARTGL